MKEICHNSTQLIAHESTFLSCQQKKEDKLLWQGQQTFVKSDHQCCNCRQVRVGPLDCMSSWIKMET